MVQTPGDLGAAQLLMGETGEKLEDSFVLKKSENPQQSSHVIPMSSVR